jgi:hypothetical protein
MPVSDIFVVMPFGAQKVSLAEETIDYDKVHFDDLYELICEAARAHNPVCEVARMEKKHGNLVSAIIRRIAQAEVVVAVLSGRNPNVFYELGVRHALRRGTIMLVADRREYPFDLSGYYSEQYSIASSADRKGLRKFLMERFVEYDATPLNDSPVLDVLEIAEREQWRALNHWETRRAFVVLQRLIMEMSALDDWLLALQSSISETTVELDTDGLNPYTTRPSIGVLRAFSDNTPLVGLKGTAYIDASNLYVTFNTLITTVLETTDEERTDDANLAVLQERTARSHANLIAFSGDLMSAIAYVLRTKTCYSIPWADSMDLVDKDYLDNVDSKREQWVDQYNSLIPQLTLFDGSFSGAPPNDP